MCPPSRPHRNKATADGALVVQNTGRQMYDEKKNEHVIYLEYRFRVKPGGMNVPSPEALRLLRDLVGSGGS